MNQIETTNVHIVIDHENHAEKFWMHLGEYDVIHMAPISDEARQAIAWLLESAPGHDEVTVPSEVADELLAWLETLPGWNDGPEYARHPIVANPS